MHALPSAYKPSEAIYEQAPLTKAKLCCYTNTAFSPFHLEKYGHASIVIPGFAQLLARWVLKQASSRVHTGMGLYSLTKQQAAG